MILEYILYSISIFYILYMYFLYITIIPTTMLYLLLSFHVFLYNYFSTMQNCIKHFIEINFNARFHKVSPRL